jgi:hypothetical protein
VKRIFTILFLIIVLSPSYGQIRLFNRYYPADNTDTIRKLQVSASFSEGSNSNSFTNEFYSSFNKSEFINDDLKNRQIGNLKSPVLTGDIRNIGIDAFFASGKNQNTYYYIGIEHQYYLNTSLDEDVIKLILLGNKPFAGQTLSVPDSKYYSIYFNQVKGGMGHRIDKPGGIHHITGNIAVNFGQNYNELLMKNSSLYTDVNGEYLNIDAEFNTHLSDTVWAEWYDIRGIGASVDFEYDFDKPGNFHFDIAVKNLGFITWTGNSFIGETDTSFVFEGISIDTTGNNGDLSVNSIRNLIFNNISSANFTTGLPLRLNFSVGKYFASAKGYAGIRGNIYPTFNALFQLEAFASYNIKNIVQLTPVVAYSSYKKVNYGLFVGLSLGKNVNIQLGSAYLNSLFGNNSLLGKGGFIRLTIMN